MTPVRMMQMTIHQVIHMIPVGYRPVSAIRPVDVPCFVAPTYVIRRANVRIRRTHFHHVLVHVITMHRMQVAVVQIIHVIAVLHGRVAAAFSVDVGMIRMNKMFGHRTFPFLKTLGSFVTPATTVAGASLACASALKTKSRMCWSASE